MKLLVIALLTAVAFSANADLLRRPDHFKKVSTLRCYLDKNENGRVSKDEVLFQADADSQTIIDTKTKLRYTVTSAVVSELPNGRPGRMTVSGYVKGAVFAGGGSATIKIETDYMSRVRWNSTVTLTTSTFYNGSNPDSKMMDCSL